MLTGDNGLLNQTTEATKKTDIAGTREQIELELMGKYDTTGNYTNNDVIEAVKIATGQEIEEGTATITTAKGNEVDISDLWKVTGGSVDTIPTDANYECYYADIDGNGTVDGIIYADLAVGGSGTWESGDSASSYSYSVQSGLKEYYISQDNYTDDFGTKPVLAPVEGTEGNDRFYVMALDDVDSSTHPWYYEAQRCGMSDYSTTTSADFGTGKQNTINMIDKWNNSKYGSQTTTGSYPDMWGVIQGSETYPLVTSADDSGKWFVPSIAEWSVFGGAFDISEDSSSECYYAGFGLDSVYWSSSQSALYGSYTIWFSYGGVDGEGASSSENVRLSTTF